MRTKIGLIFCFLFLAMMQGCCATQSQTKTSAAQMSVQPDKLTWVERFDVMDKWMRDHFW